MAGAGTVGATGELKRLAFTGIHYNVLHVREAWEREAREVQEEWWRQMEGNQERPSVKEVSMGTHMTSIARRLFGERQRRTRRQRMVAATRELTIQLQDLSEEIDEADVELLASLADVGCSEEEQAALAQVLGHSQPWEILGVPMEATEEEGKRAFRKLSLHLHPDKCKHPRGQDAFQRLAEAYKWSYDRSSWEEMQRQKMQEKEPRLKYHRWVAEGGPLIVTWVEEMYGRLVLEIEEDSVWLHQVEQHAFEVLSTEWSQEVLQLDRGQSLSQRARSKPHYYQSAEEEEKEKKRRRERS